MSDTDGRQSPWRAVAAATAFNAPIGSLYAFSVFLRPLESLLGVSRADLALVFALAAAGFGAGMNLAPYVYGVASPPLLVLACAAASTLGIALAATAGGKAGIPCLLYGPGVIRGSQDEDDACVLVSDMVKVTRVLAVTALDVCRREPAELRLTASRRL